MYTTGFFLSENAISITFQKYYLAKSCENDYISFNNNCIWMNYNFISFTNFVSFRRAYSFFLI